MSLKDKSSENGNKCLASRGGFWERAFIRRLNEDGTFNIEFEIEPKRFLRTRYGVTSKELSFDDEGAWERAFPSITAGKSTLDIGNFLHALGVIGFGEDSFPEFRQIWINQGKVHSKESVDAPLQAQLEKDRAYQLFRSIGFSAKNYLDCVEFGAKAGYAIVYYNEIRMGGRDPKEIAREVTIEDALAAMGTLQRKEDESSVSAFKRLEAREEIVLPSKLKTILNRQGAARRFHNSHPNNYDLLNHKDLKDLDGILLRNIRTLGIDGDYALRIVSRDFDWFAVFNHGDNDARVYLRDFTRDEHQKESWSLAAPTVTMFFWDIAQTALIWFEENGQTNTEKSDIGLIVKPPKPVPNKLRRRDQPRFLSVNEPQNMTYSFIDKNGHRILPESYRKAWTFSGGIGLVYDDGEEMFRFVNSFGEPLFSLSSEGVSVAPGRFCYGLAAVERGGLWGFVDRLGQFRIEPKFLGARFFSKGLAPVMVSPGNFGYVDEYGELRIPALYTVAEPHCDGLALCRQNDKFGYLNESGEFAIEPKPTFEYATSFSEGLAAVLLKKGWCFIDTSGAIVLEGPFQSAQPFAEGLARVWSEGRGFYIDKLGTELKIKFQAVEHHNCSDGLIPVFANNLIGFIDKSGELVIEPGYRETLGFSEGYAAVSISGEWGYIDHTGQLQIPLQFSHAESFKDGIAVVGELPPE